MEEGVFSGSIWEIALIKVWGIFNDKTLINAYKQTPVQVWLHFCTKITVNNF